MFLLTNRVSEIVKAVCLMEYYSCKSVMLAQGKIAAEQRKRMKVEWGPNV